MLFMVLPNHHIEALLATELVVERVDAARESRRALSLRRSTSPRRRTFSVRRRERVTSADCCA